MPELVAIESPTARKHHSCDDCGRTVNPGEKYMRQFVIGDYGPYRWKRCAHCRAFLSLYSDEIDPYGDEGIDDEIIRDWEPATPEAVEHKRRRLIGWRHGRDLYPVPGEVSADV